MVPTDDIRAVLVARREGHAREADRLAEAVLRESDADARAVLRTQLAVELNVVSECSQQIEKLDRVEAKSPKALA